MSFLLVAMVSAPDHCWCWYFVAKGNGALIEHFRYLCYALCNMAVQCLSFRNKTSSFCVWQAKHGLVLLVLLSSRRYHQALESAWRTPCLQSMFGAFFFIKFPGLPAYPIYVLMVFRYAIQSYFIKHLAYRYPATLFFLSFQNECI